MKTALLASLLVLSAMAGPPAAGEPFELGRTQLDQVTAGAHRSGVTDITLKRGMTESAPSPETGDEVMINFESGDPGQIIELRVGTSGTQRSSHGGHVITEVTHRISR